MPFDVSKYTITNKRSLWRAIRLKWILHKRKCLRSHKEVEEKKHLEELSTKQEFQGKKEEAEIEEARMEIAKNRLFPTSETINFNIYLDIGELLLYFFPNSFKNADNAFEYYINYCEQARSLGEPQEVYKEKNIINEGVHIKIQLDMKSGQKNIWNYYYQNDSFAVGFNFFNYDYIKNSELKDSITKLYLENRETLEKIGICYKFNNGEIKFKSRLDITPFGLNHYVLMPAYNTFNHWVGQNKDLFSLPTDNILCAFREARTYYLRENECKELGEMITMELSKNIKKCKLDFDYNNFYKYRAEIANRFIEVFIDTEYTVPAEIITNPKTGREYFYIDIYRNNHYAAYY